MRYGDHELGELEEAEGGEGNCDHGPSEALGGFPRDHQEGVFGEGGHEDGEQHGEEKREHHGGCREGGNKRQVEGMTW